MPGQHSRAVLSEQSWAGPRNCFWGAQCEPIAPLLVPVPALLLSPGSRRAQEPFLEAVYEEIGYSPASENQARFGHSGGCGSSLEAHLQDPFPWRQPRADPLMRPQSMVPLVLGAWGLWGEHPGPGPKREAFSQSSLTVSAGHPLSSCPCTPCGTRGVREGAVLGQL